MLKIDLHTILRSMEPGKFQEFCLDFLKKYEPGLSQLRRHGGTYEGKTRKGTPDLIHTSIDGSQVAVQCSTSKTYWRKPKTRINIATWKPIEDIIKCSLHLIKAKKIILCCSQEISVSHSNIENQIIENAANYSSAEILIISPPLFVEELLSNRYKYFDVIQRHFPTLKNGLYSNDSPWIECPLSKKNHAVGLIQHVTEKISKLSTSTLKESIWKPFKNITKSSQLRASVNIEKEIISKIIEMISKNKTQLKKHHLSKRVLSSKIQIQIPFQQVSSIVLFEYIKMEYFLNTKSDILIDWSRTSSINIFSDILNGYHDDPDIVCLNLFNSIEFLSKCNSYVPILLLPAATQNLIFIDNTTDLKSKFNIYFLDKPFASLRMNYLDFLARDIIPWDANKINVFPPTAIKFLKEKEAISDVNNAFFIWYPLVAALEAKQIIKKRQIFPEDYDYPCLFLAKISMLSNPIIKALPYMISSAKEALEKSEFLINLVLNRLKYLYVLENKFNL